jgi:hypothetical protein
VWGHRLELSRGPPAAPLASRRWLGRRKGATWIGKWTLMIGDGGGGACAEFLVNFLEGVAE